MQEIMVSGIGGQRRMGHPGSGKVKAGEWSKVSKKWFVVAVGARVWEILRKECF